MSRVTAIAFHTYRETVRDKVLYNLVLFALLMIGSSYVLGQISIYQESKIIKDLGLASISIFGMVIAIFIGIGLVYKEIDKRTLYALLPKPVSRVQFLLGKYFGLCFTLFVNVSIMSVGLFALLFAMSGEVEPRLLQAIFLIYVQLALLTALAMLFSTFTTPVLSGIFTGFFYVAGHFATDLKNFDALVGHSWASSLTGAVYYLIPNFRNFDVKAQVVAGTSVSAAQFLLATAYGVAYTALLLILASVVFSRRNL